MTGVIALALYAAFLVVVTVAMPYTGALIAACVLGELGGRLCRVAY